MREINLYLIISTLMLIIQQMVQGVCLEALLTGKKGSKRTRMMSWFLFSVLAQGMKCLIIFPGIFTAFVTVVIVNAEYILFLKLYYSDRVKTKILHTAVLLMSSVLADVIYQVFGNGMNLGMDRICFNSVDMTYACVIVTVISVILNIGYTMFVLKKRKGKKFRMSPVWIMILILLMMMMVVLQHMIGTEGSDTYLVFISIFGILELTMLLLYLSYWEKEEAEREIQKLYRIMELQKIHYEQDEKQREAMEKIRHDYNNVISSVLFLMENNKIEEAAGVLKELAERIDESAEYEFCPNAIINAVITEKYAVCEAEDISFRSELLHTGELQISNLDLCMIFGNIMDNAICSCRKVQEKGGKGSIVLKGKRVRGYLIIKCENTVPEHPDMKSRGTGYGHRILADIASRYDGDFQYFCRDGIFTVQMSLKNITEEEQRNRSSVRQN